ncbi:MAG: hypothetical protein GEU78_01655 [Actinobacteria bacterium]|nr:hypothetical protein [Actinomycetota bacterium]
MQNATIDIPDVLSSELQVLDDERGSFTELMRANASLDGFVQSNRSHSKEGVRFIVYRPEYPATDPARLRY